MNLLNFCGIILLIVCAGLSTAQEDCGKQKSAQQLVFGGSAVAEGEWPWIVSLFLKKNNYFFCSANLISHQHLLTAAHCIYEKSSLGSKSPQDIYAYIGRLNISVTRDEPKSIKSDIKQIIIHPDWKSQDLRFDADIAILVLSNPIEYNDVIQPVCLPNPVSTPFDTSGYVVGYGKSESETVHEDIPRKALIKSVSNEACFFIDFNFAKFASPRTFCAGERGKTPCKGDSGAGYFISNGTSFQITGIVSAAVVQKCGENDLVLFTNVAKFSMWVWSSITNTENDNSFDSVFNSFDEDGEQGEKLSSNEVNAQCTFRNSGTTYGCYIDDLQAPDTDITLNINGGTHKSGRTSRDVSVMHMKGGRVTHFPEMTKVMQTFPNLNGFGITFTKLNKIKRSELKELEPLKFFLISDNDIEYIPPDTFQDLKNLELIDICRNRIKNIEENWLETMPKLRVFKARSNKFQYVPARMFNNNPELEEILFDSNEIKTIETNFGNLRNIKTIAILSNPCISLKYCQSSNDEQCVKNIQQFSYFVLGHCGEFNNQ